MVASSSVHKNWSTKLPSPSRFTVLSAFGDAAVRDDETGLVWETTLETTELSWTDACTACADKDVGGRKGWRLPSISASSGYFAKCLNCRLDSSWSRNLKKMAGVFSEC
jgi:hypothetical protein